MARLETAAAGGGISARSGDPAWVTDFRRAALAIYHDTPLPERSRHLWRYTDPRVFLPSVDRFEDAAAGAAGDSLAPAWPPDMRASWEKEEIDGVAIWQAGRLRGVELRDGARRAGVLLLDLNAALREHPEQVRRVLGRLVGPEFGKFEAWNAAAFRGGVFLYVPRGVQVEKPIHVRELLGAGPFEATRVVALVEDGASVTLVDELSGGPENGRLQLYVVGELEIGAGARVNHVTLQELSARTLAHVTQRSRLGRDARIVPVIASFGGERVKTDTGALLEGSGSESEMTGFLSAIGRRSFDHHTLHHHLGRHTRSNLDYRTVLQDRSRSAYTGLIRIEPEASFSQAYQENRNLLLTANCRADSIPELEIMTEEVQCTHGATVGPIDGEHLFYLMSRGVPRGEAVRMIVEGHFEPTLRRLPEGLQERLRGILRERL